ncbi:MAG: 1,4-dihydroxy-2-naphthoate octaprenyltransferase [Woeseiaceae bacterium]|nr:1,4-dihydroxy-2-naphthoate octaprenyltransferase [Woeseiaceae bacterium]
MTQGNSQSESISRPRVWLLGIRPRTLTMAAVPVAVGAALAWAQGSGIDQLTFTATMACAILIQIGTNLFNDASDGQQGADGPDRLGPLRITGAGLATVRQVRQAAFISFALALAAGIHLVAVGGVFILAIGLASLVAGYAYSSGPRPLSYGPWGEAYVIGFFGIIAVAGSYYLQSQQLPDLAVVLTGIAIGCPAAAVLLVNNLRDLDADTRAGRRTLAARIGADAARWLYALLMLAPYPLVVAALGWRHSSIALLALPLSAWLIVTFWQPAAGPAMNQQLARTAVCQAVIGVLLLIALLR